MLRSHCAVLPPACVIFSSMKTNSTPTSTSPPNYPALLTIAEAARVLRVSRNHAYQLANQYLDSDGTAGLPAIKLGRLTRIPEDGLIRFMRGEQPTASA